MAVCGNLEIIITELTKVICFFIFVNFKLHNKQNWQTQCLYRLVIPDVNKNDFIQGAGWLGKNDVTWGQANSTSMPPDQKTKQS